MKENVSTYSLTVSVDFLLHCFVYIPISQFTLMDPNGAIYLPDCGSNVLPHNKHYKIALLVYAYIYLDRYLIDFLRASEAQRGSKYLYFFS